ncbi:MAG TPA: mechanosensitive ion channel domain-containing protein [Mesorhizobium sp.]|uniref:mechanosensitive ion channel family protein n=1 Tax=Mesorhizobium sp. TaxID=1871066 RepID=UPI002DDD0356|nr:mechanosensitive ion channel domain-containing protein [Mesorhizobium sp.]HEV2505963.1 mechanosensitive ion channel domain-containing protein [Mesorhizobium sp.]
MNDDVIPGVSTAWLISNLWSLLVAVLVLGAGWFIARIVSRYATVLLSRSVQQDQTIVPIVGQSIHYAIMAVTIIVVLGQFGVQTASILAVLGAAGLAVALALQGTLSNIAAGIMLVFLRPFNTGDYIDADGIVGTVVEVGLFSSQLRTRDGVYIFAPNSKLSNAKILNYTREPSRMVEMTFNVPRSTDLDAVRSKVSPALETQFSLPDTRPEILVETLGDTSVTMTARVPVRSRDWWQARSVLQEKLKVSLDAMNG